MGQTFGGDGGRLNDEAIGDLHMGSKAAQAEAIFSTYGSDPMLGEMVELYVAEMPERIAALERAFSEGDRESLRRTAHQMKGAAGSYGFDPLTDAAAELESAVREDQPRLRIQHALEELIGRCRRIRAGAAH
jgi:HPt (histidine-containing phosphotransfer) domain-containing protein